MLQCADEKDGQVTGTLSRLDLIFAVALWTKRLEERWDSTAQSCKRVCMQSVGQGGNDANAQARSLQNKQFCGGL